MGIPRPLGGKEFRRINKDPRIDEVITPSHKNSNIYYISLRPGFSFKPNKFARYDSSWNVHQTHFRNTTRDFKVLMRRLQYCYCKGCRAGIVNWQMCGVNMSYLGDWVNGVKGRE